MKRSKDKAAADARACATALFRSVFFIASSSSSHQIRFSSSSLSSLLFSLSHSMLLLLSLSSPVFCFGRHAVLLHPCSSPPSLLFFLFFYYYSGPSFGNGNEDDDNVVF